MTSLAYEDVAPAATAFLAIVRGRYRPPSIPSPEAAAATAAARDLPRAELASAIRGRLESLGAPPESLAAAARLATPGVVAVVAGQQPALFGGPQMILSKALAAVAWARRFEAGGRPCVPVFWSAAEDHDHGEADHVGVLDREGAFVRLRCALPGDGRMLSRVPLPGGGAEALAELARCLPDGPGRDAAVEAARPAPGDTIADAFARTLLRLVGRFGVVVVEPETLRPFARSVARFEIARPGEMAAAIRSVEADLGSATGAPPPLGLRREGLLYAVEGGVRLPLEFSEGEFVVGGQRHSRSSLLERVDRDPASFSWNVATRVVAQNAALPVAAQVCGPSELAYCAVLGEAHRIAGVPPSALLPRPGMTWVAARDVARCRRLGADPSEVVRRGVSAFRGSEPAAAPRVSEIRLLLEALPGGPGRAVARRRAALLRQLALYEAAFERERREGCAVAEGRRRRVLAALRPGGALQERELSILPFLARHGEAMLDRVFEALARPGAEHEVILAAGDR